MQSWISKCLALALMSVGLTACVVVPGHRGYGHSAPSQGAAVIVDAAPPAAYYEAPAPMPYPGAVWISGYWGWSGGRHHWVPGYYERPRSGYRYAPHHWEPHGGGRWRLRLGGWARL